MSDNSDDIFGVPPLTSAQFRDYLLHGRIPKQQPQIPYDASLRDAAPEAATQDD